MQIPFHGIRAAELWNSFAVGGSGGKGGKSCEAEPITPSLPEGMGRAAADGSAGQDPMAQSPSPAGFLGPAVGGREEGEGRDQTGALLNPEQTEQAPALRSCTLITAL